MLEQMENKDEVEDCGSLGQITAALVSHEAFFYQRN
jgi:hypothetical protein